MLAVSLLVFSGCEQPAEEFEVPSWTPVVAVPLVDTRFDLADVLEVLTDSLDTVPVVGLEGGRLAFVHTEDFSGTLAPDWLTLPDVIEAADLVLDEELATAINLTPPGTVLTLSDTMVSEMTVDNPPGALVDLVVLSEGVLTLTVSSTMGDDVEGQLSIPMLFDPNGMPWSVAWTADMLESGSFVVTEDLTGWSIEPENLNVQDTNVVRAIFDVDVVNNAEHTAEEGESLSASFVMSGQEFERVEGDFGSSEIYLEEGNTTVALFDDRFTVSGAFIDEATISIEVTNGFGVEASLDSVSLRAVEDGVVTNALEVSAPPLNVPPAEGSAQMPSVTSWFMDQTNSNITSFFSAEPQVLELSAWVTSNPNGFDPANPNFVDADGFVAGELRVEVPLALRLEQLDFVDTLDATLEFEEEEMELDSAELRLILHNGFPFGVEVALTFLDEFGVALDSLSMAPLPLFTMPVLDGEGEPLEPAVFVYDLLLNWDRADRLRAMNSVVVRAWSSTAEAQSGETVYLNEGQELRLELAAKLYARVDL
ncbi:hypothetical protein OAG26_01175 [Flavobacteriales bacterium]|nr:hypothetical protein [Flavobacteriales bacterium]